MKTEPNILICDCSSEEHQIVIRKDQDDNMVYCHIHLTQHGFWRRLLKGVKYIFGYKSKYGHWDEFIFTPKHVEKLKEITDILSQTK